MKVAILGCGTIGASWAALFATAGGHQVAAWDPDETVREAFVARTAQAQRQLAELGYSQVGEVAFEPDLGKAVADAGWVQENAPENLTLKHALYAELAELLGPGAILASSTSSFTWSQLAAGPARPPRLLVCHPFHPPHLIPLVELYCPDAEATVRAREIMTGLGRAPVVMKREAVGHIANRLASALWREAVNIVAEGIADVADVDEALIQGPALRWSVLGTHMGYHLGGGAGGIEHYLRHLGPSQERRWASLGDPRLTPEVCALIAAGVAEEAAGRSIAELEAERDRWLIAALQARGGQASLVRPGEPA